MPDMLKELRIAGFGGQGVILSANVIGRATTLYESNFATMIQSFGPEARGGAASATLILSDEAILYPYVSHPDILVVMSQEAYTRFTPELKPGGILLVEQDLVHLDNAADGKCVHSIPATRIAEALGKKMVLNVVMTGFLCATGQVVSYESCRKAVSDLVPARFRDLNLEAFEKGHEFGMTLTAPSPSQEDVDAALMAIESLD